MSNWITRNKQSSLDPFGVSVLIWPTTRCGLSRTCRLSGRSVVSGTYLSNDQRSVTANDVTHRHVEDPVLENRSSGRLRGIRSSAGELNWTCLRPVTWRICGPIRTRLCVLRITEDESVLLLLCFVSVTSLNYKFNWSVSSAAAPVNTEPSQNHQNISTSAAHVWSAEVLSWIFTVFISTLESLQGF